MQENIKQEDEPQISFKSFFIPFTTIKAIHYLLIIGLIVFGNSLFNDFVGDDYGQIIYNSAVHSPVNIPKFFISSTFDIGNGLTGNYYKPLLLTTYSLLYSSFNQSAFIFHFVQLFLHISNSILLFILLRRFIDKKLSFFLAIIFLVHPINQDTVAYISNLQDAMFFFFGICGLILYTSKRIVKFYPYAFILFACSLLSKETGIILLLINILYTFYFCKERFKKALIYTILLLIPYFYFHFLAVQLSFLLPNEYHISRLSLIERIINIPAILFFYVSSLFYPMELAVSYDWVITKVDYPNFFFPLLVFLIVAIYLFYIFNKIKKYHNKAYTISIFFLLWFVLGLSLHLQIIPLDATVSPRWFYLPFAGLLGLIGILIDQSLDRKKMKFVLILLITLSFLLSVRTIQRNTDFKDNYTLTCHDAVISKNNFSLENSCAASLFMRGSYAEAELHAERSVQLAPHSVSNWYTLGTILVKNGEINKDRKLIEKAENAFKKATKNNPNLPSAYENLGYLYVYYKDPKYAKSFLINALNKYPRNYKLWQYLATADYKLGNLELAKDAINNAYFLNPKDKFISNFHDKINEDKEVSLKKIDF